MTRACATCGQLFHTDPRTPSRRYCTPRCRAADWRHRHSMNSPNAANAVNDVRNVAGGSNDVTNAANRGGRAGHALGCCPHCQMPIAVLTLLIPPAAAHVNPPQAAHG